MGLRCAPFSTGALTPACQFNEMVLDHADLNHCAASTIQPVPENLHQVERDTIPEKERSLFQVIFEKEKKLIYYIYL